MRVGTITAVLPGRLARVQQLGFPAGIGRADWRTHALEVAAEAKSRGLRISALGALYRNPLDPRQTEGAAAAFRHAAEVAAHIGVNTISGFGGAVIETDLNERGGHPIYRPMENYIPRFLAFWEPIARFAADRGVRIAFEHCPMGQYHLPIMGFNMMAKPAIWERIFSDSKCDNLGIEWDAAHLVCQFIDPVANVRKFGRRIFHVHAKDGFVNKQLLEMYGPCHYGVTEHRMVGLGQSNWAEIVHALRRAGYDSDLNIEGRHDPVYRDHGASQPEDVICEGEDFQEGQQLEETGLLIAKRVLEQYVFDVP
jgi:sugar phosphate isomerase/epimerase